MPNIILTKIFIRTACRLAIKEDMYPLGDITSNLLGNNSKKKMKLIANENCIIGGLEFAKQVFNQIDKKIKFVVKKKEGTLVKKKTIIATVEGNIKNILIGERVALNFISHISGIATKTNQFVKKVEKKTKICCTRKTIPNLRVIQKYAVKLGGGTNHRFNLSDEYLIKDNHVGSVKSFEEIIKKAIREKKGKKITVEVDNLNQLKKIKGLKFDTVLFDNMKPQNIKSGIKLIRNIYETEASGGITLKNIKKISKTGVNRISIGQLTHSISAIDLKIEI